jgi:hypothetical protein
LLPVDQNSVSSRVVSIGGYRTVGASGVKPMRQAAMLRRQRAMAAWLVLLPAARL